jgi:hypothetical protein
MATAVASARRQVRRVLTLFALILAALFVLATLLEVIDEWIPSGTLKAVHYQPVGILPTHHSSLLTGERSRPGYGPDLPFPGGHAFDESIAAEYTTGTHGGGRDGSGGGDSSGGGGGGGGDGDGTSVGLGAHDKHSGTQQTETFRNQQRQQQQQQPQQQQHQPQRLQLQAVDLQKADARALEVLGPAPTLGLGGGDFRAAHVGLY